MAGQAKILTFKEIELVFKILETARERSLFGLGIYTGMRIGEIIRLQQDQVFTEDGGVRYQLTVKRLKKKAQSIAIFRCIRNYGSISKSISIR